MLVGGVADAPVVQIVVEAGLVDGVHRAQPHRDRGELPEVGHQPRMRVGRQAAPGMAVLLAEAVELVGAEPALQEGPGVDPRRGVPLKEHLIAPARMGLPAEEVIEADLVERGRGGVGGDVPADADAGALRAVHHDGGVPADPAPVTAFDLLVAGKPGLELGRNGVDVVRRGQRGYRDPLLTGPLQHPEHEVPGPGRTGAGQQVVEGLQPLGGLLGVDVGQVGRDAFPDDAHPVGFIWAA